MKNKSIKGIPEFFGYSKEELLTIGNIDAFMVYFNF